MSTFIDIDEKYFNKEMTYFEAHKRLFLLLQEKPENEKNKIKQEYKKMLEIISNRDKAEDVHSLITYSL